MSWRPGGWKNPYTECNKSCRKLYGGHPFDAVEEAAFEAGADAMYEPAYEKGKEDGKKESLEALRKRGYKGTFINGVQFSRGYVSAGFIGAFPFETKGKWVFIPDDPLEPPAKPQDPHAYDEG